MSDQTAATPPAPAGDRALHQAGRVVLVLAAWGASALLLFAVAAADAARSGLPEPTRVAALVTAAGPALLAVAIALTLLGLLAGRVWGWPVVIGALWLLVAIGLIEAAIHLPALFVPLLGVAALLVLLSLVPARRRPHLPAAHARGPALAVAALYALAFAVPQGASWVAAQFDGWSDGHPLPVGLGKVSAAISGGVIYAVAEYTQQSGGLAEPFPATSSLIHMLDIGEYPRVPEPEVEWAVAPLDHPGRLVGAPGGRIYILGSEGRLQVYSPPVVGPEGDIDKGGLVTDLPPLAGYRTDSALAVDAAGRLYVFGGIGDVGNEFGALSRVDSYDPDAGTWSTRAPLPRPRTRAAAVTTGDGLIYVFGGEDPDGGRSIGFGVDVYDPAADSWSAGAYPEHPRYGHAAAEGRDGRLYLMGGFTVGGDDEAAPVLALDVDTYDPRSDSWSKWVAPGGAARPEPAAVRAPDGLIYLIGGGTDMSSRRRVDILLTPER